MSAYFVCIDDRITNSLPSQENMTLNRTNYLLKS